MGPVAAAESVAEVQAVQPARMRLQTRRAGTMAVQTLMGEVVLVLTTMVADMAEMVPRMVHPEDRRGTLALGAREAMEYRRVAHRKLRLADRVGKQGRVVLRAVVREELEGAVKLFPIPSPAKATSTNAAIQRTTMAMA